MTIKQQPYHVLDVNGKEVFTGTHQECLRYEIDSDDICLQVLPCNDDESPEVYELSDDDYTINYED
jgi:hypothetical protein